MSAELDDLLETLDVETLFDSFGLDYRRTSGGSDLQLRECPACKDDRWRCYFSTRRRRGICFHADCNKRFNLFSFTRSHLEATASGTIRFFEDYARRNLGRSISKPTPVIQRVVGDWVMPPSVELPTDTGMTHPYLIDRKVLLTTQAHFGLRWCESGWFDYEDAAGRARRMPFGGRILVPICDIDGGLVNFVGRDATGQGDPRYLFPPSLPSAGRYLFGSQHAMGRQHLVAGEGPFDAIGIHQAIADHPDFRDAAAIATFGISIGHADQTGDDQLGRLRRLRKAGLRRLTLLWDGERNALLRALDSAEVVHRSIAGLQVAIGLLPADSDPGELETWRIRQAIERAMPFSALTKARLLLNCPYK